MKLQVRLVPAVSVFLPEASSEIRHQLPDEGEQGVVVGVLSDLQVPVDEGAEVVGEELGEHVVGEKLAQVQAVLQEEADELGSVLDEGREHDFLQVGGLRRKSRENTQPDEGGARLSLPATSYFPSESIFSFPHSPVWGENVSFRL